MIKAHKFHEKQKENRQNVEYLKKTPRRGLWILWNSELFIITYRFDQFFLWFIYHSMKHWVGLPLNWWAIQNILNEPSHSTTFTLHSTLLNGNDHYSKRYIITRKKAESFANSITYFEPISHYFPYSCLLLSM